MPKAEFFKMEQPIWLSEFLITRNQRELLELGSVYINQKRELKDRLLNEGDLVRLHTTPRRYEISNLKHAIVFLNDEFVIVNKPAFVPVHPTLDNIHENVLSVLEKDLNQKLFITQRLDISTSGLMLIARTSQFQKKFNQVLMNREIKKIYHALVQNSFTGELHHMMEQSRFQPKIISDSGTLKCHLSVLESRAYDPNCYELKIQLHTGRTHQIRAQLAYEKNPLIGDVLYGSTIKAKGPCLISTEVEFLEYKFSLPSWSYSQLLNQTQR